jgi:hypothetical protein
MDSWDFVVFYTLVPHHRVLAGEEMDPSLTEVKELRKKRTQALKKNTLKKSY